LTNNRAELAPPPGGAVIRSLTYEALPSQRRFLGKPERFKGFSGPVGSGKSCALCFEAVRLAYQNPGRTGLVGAPTYGMLSDVTVRALVEHCDRLRIKTSYNRSSRILHFCDTGSQVLLRSMDHADRLRGTNLAWFGLDELTYCSEDSWLRLEARLRDPDATRLSGFGVWTPKGFDWVHRKFIGSNSAEYGIVRARPFENQHLLAGTPDYYERLRTSYDERFFEQEVLGKYLSLGAGRVYREFDRERNVQECCIQPGDCLIVSWDFNVNPMTVLVAQSLDGAVHVHDEIVLHSSTTEEALEEFEARYGGHCGGMRFYGDASGGQHKTSSRFSDLEIIRSFVRSRPGWRADVRFGKANPPVRDRVNLVNGRLKSASGDIRLRISPRCGSLIEDLEETVYKEGSSVVDKSDGRRTHATDALGYLLWGEHAFHHPVGEQAGRLF